ncbi:MAG: hypothetical protein R3B91_10670 [Planctomycetaceae bacterium]
MHLNDYLYANGEVTKLWMYPRGPDSGFNVYPGQGNRWGFFDTTPLAHALNEPCYIVEPHPPGTKLIPNGLPVFTLYFENDDECRRTLGSDSKLFFTAPQDGDYLVKLKDVRGQQGPEYRYSLSIRPRQPDFQVKVQGENPTVSPGSAKEFTVQATRLDGYEDRFMSTSPDCPTALGYNAAPHRSRSGRGDGRDLGQCGCGLLQRVMQPRRPW